MKKFVTSLELSKRLKGLGVKQESEYYWIHDEEMKKNKYDLMVSNYGYSENSFSAFLSDELLELLPRKLEVIGWLVLRVGPIGRAVRYESEKSVIECVQINNSLPNALAKMLIYLIENKLMEVPK